MELTLAILIVLGIFIGIPAVVGFAIAGVYLLSDRRARRSERAETVAKTEAPELAEQTVRVKH
jgi:hypothetical protein